MCIDLILNIVNTICQVTLTILAIITLFVAIKQIRGKRKYDMRASYICGMGLVQKNDDEIEVVVGVTINLINIGLGPVYYNHCGLIFVKDNKASKRKSYPGIISSSTIKMDVKTLRPGESSNESTHNLELLLKKLEEEKSINTEDKVYIYVDLCSGRELRYNTGDTYKDFLDKYNEVVKRSKKDNKQLSGRTCENKGKVRGDEIFEKTIDS